MAEEVILTTPTQLKALLIEAVSVALKYYQPPVIPPVSPDEDKFIGVEDAALFLNIKRQTVYQNIDKIPHEKRHGRLYFTRRQLRNYLNQDVS